MVIKEMGGLILLSAKDRRRLNALKKFYGNITDNEAISKSIEVNYMLKISSDFL